MSVKLRLRRKGRRKRPIWAIVAADSRKPRDGRYIEDVGRYYPLEQPARINLKEQRVLYWLKQGAQPSDTVRSMLSKQGLMLAHHLQKQGRAAEEIQQAVAEHRAKRADKDGEVSITAEDRRQAALEAERERVEELEAKEAEEARKRREAEEQKKAEEEAQQAEAEATEGQEEQTADEDQAAEAEETEASAEAASTEEPEPPEEETTAEAKGAEAAEAEPQAEEDAAGEEETPEEKA